jgi:hypothetical protein
MGSSIGSTRVRVPSTLKSRGPAAEAAPWSEVILVCVKCAAKLGRALHGKSELRGDIKRALKDRGIKGVRVLDTTCLDLCPKGGQTLALGRELASGTLRVLDEDGDADGVVNWLAGLRER